MFLTATITFFLLFFIRHGWIKKVKWVCAFHLVTSGVLFFLLLAGTSVQDAGYRRLEVFKSLEKNNQLEAARANPKSVSSMLAIDLDQFKTSKDFEAYLAEYDQDLVNRDAEARGWFLVFLSDMVFALLFLGRRFFARMGRHDKN